MRCRGSGHGQTVLIWLVTGNGTMILNVIGVISPRLAR